VIHMLFVTIITAGLIANERRSIAFSQKIRLKHRCALLFQ